MTDELLAIHGFEQWHMGVVHETIPEIDRRNLFHERMSSSELVQCSVRRNRIGDLTGKGTLVSPSLSAGGGLCSKVMWVDWSDIGINPFVTERIHNNIITGPGEDLAEEDMDAFKEKKKGLHLLMLLQLFKN